MSKKSDKTVLAFEGEYRGHNDLNVTVRQGDKWLERYIAVGGSFEVVIADENGLQIDARVVEVWYMPFSRLPSIVFELEHDPRCRTRKGLRKQMEQCYPGFGPAEMVSVVFYLPE